MPQRQLLEVEMQRVSAAVGISFLLVTLPAFVAFAADPPSAADDAALQKACMKLAADPFAGSGPKEWSTPFQSIDPFKAIPVCKEALRLHPDDANLKLAAAFAYIAGRKSDQAKPLLDQLVAQNNSDAMLALAFISKGAAATELMLKAGESGNASGLMLYGMAQLLGKGVPKDETEGVRTLRRAAEAGSTRAMLVLANLYYKGDYGVGYDPDEARRLLVEAAGLGDPGAKEALANLERNAAEDAAKN
jgi:TPR repeat protein